MSRYTALYIFENSKESFMKIFFLVAADAKGEYY